MIKKFDACLVPDDGSQLSGKMTEALPKQVNVIRIGLLSRFSSFKSEPEKKHVLVVLSGPEPQRTLFEDAIRQAAKDFHGAIVVVRGSNKSLLNAFPDNVEVHNMAGTKLLKSLFKQCSYVVCRSGYSSLMDLVAIKRDAVIVPTPGQPEQEYLADLVAGRGWFVVQNQKTFRFLNPSEVVNACNIPELSVNTFNTALGNLLHSKGGYKKNQQQ
jgi:UDP-N-acetylglucosamine:LPS N-acetylglucosamine transferase